MAAFQVGTGAETMTLGEVKGHETYKASGLMNITSLSAAQASSPISVVVDMGLKELTAYEVVVFLEDAIGNVSSRLVSPHATTLDETPPAVVAFAVDAAATTETSISACIKAYDAGSAFSVYAKAFAAGVSVADSDTVEKLGGAGAALVVAGVTNASETDATTNPIDIDLTDLTASTAYDIVVLMVDTATPVPNILRYQYTQSVTTAAPPISRSVEFDGDGGYLNVSNEDGVIIPGLSNFSISMWVNQNQSNRFIMGDLETSGTQGFEVVFSSNKLQIEMHSPSSSIRYNSTSTFVQDIWYHITLIADRETNTFKVYVNGIDDNAQTIHDSTNFGSSSDITTNTQNFVVGKRHTQDGVGSLLDGNIDELAVFKSILTASDVATIYNNGAPLDLRTNTPEYTQSGALEAYWKFDGDFLDRSGNGHDLISAGPNVPTFSTSVPAPVSRSVQLSNNNYLTNDTFSTADMTSTGEFTASLWLNMLSAPTQSSNHYNLFALGYPSQFYYKYNGEFRHWQGNSETTLITQNLTLNMWYNLVISNFKDGNTKVYLNGVKVLDTPSFIPDLQNGKLAIGVHTTPTGGDGQTDRVFNGFIDEFKLFDGQISDDDVTLLYNGGTPPVDVSSITTPVLASYSMNGDYLDRSGNGYHLSAAGSPTFSYSVPNPKLFERYMFTPDNTQYEWVNGIFTGGASGLGHPPTSYRTIDGRVGGDFGAFGTALGLPANWTPIFAIETNQNPLTSGFQSVTTNNIHGYSMFLHVNDGFNYAHGLDNIILTYVGTGDNFRLRLHQSTFNNIEGLEIFVADAVVHAEDTKASGIDQNWMHIYIQVDPITNKYEFYLNGNLIYETFVNDTFKATETGNAKFRIGQDTSGITNLTTTNGSINGIISDLRIYKAELSPLEIMDIYNEL